MAEENIGGKKRLIGEVLPSKMEKTIVVAVKIIRPIRSIRSASRFVRSITSMTNNRLQDLEIQ